MATKYEMFRERITDMALLQTWREMAYSSEVTPEESERFWNGYFQLEQGIYRQILANPEEIVQGTVKELAEKYQVDLMIMVGFLDGINDSLTQPNPIDEMEEDTPVNLGYDKEKLYWHMVEAKAKWLYELPEWDALLTEERRKELYKDQKQSGTIRKGKKIGRNEPCPCGSGKKYKKCCGKNA